MKYASLCLLAYKRPEQLRNCIHTLIETADYPYELIVNLDGDDSGNSEYLFDLYKAKEISKLIVQSGNNRGVGRSFANCIGVAEGDYIFKIDTDLTFRPNWLSTSIKILDDQPDVGAVSLFNYNNYDEKDERFKVTAARLGCYLVNDFVSSIYGFRKEDLVIGGYNQDDGFHTKLGNHRGKLAITPQDYVSNSGFGVTRSTYVQGDESDPTTWHKTPTSDNPLIFQSGRGV